MYYKTKYIILIFHYDKQFAAFQLKHYEYYLQLHIVKTLNYMCYN